MLTKFARFIIFISGVGVMFSAGSPFLIRAQTYYEFRSLGMESAVDKVTKAKIQSAASSLALGFILSVAGAFVGVGLLRRREWARRGWLFICTIWVVLMVAFLGRSPDTSRILPLAFWGIICAVSFSILTKPAIRSEFSNDRHVAKRA
jgi:hypothetical protein